MIIIVVVVVNNNSINNFPICFYRHSQIRKEDHDLPFLTCIAHTIDVRLNRIHSAYKWENMRNEYLPLPTVGQCTTSQSVSAIIVVAVLTRFRFRLGAK